METKDAETEWLQSHQDSPIVKEAIRRTMRSEKFRSILSGAGRPQGLTPTERKADRPAEHYQARVKRWQEKRQQALQARELFGGD
ncbi:MAG: hypothetical protein ABIP48_17665 [Planctomycetota bacterium]